ncbi:MAG: 50S ribosomal protein L4 [Nanoarchaeota archaeon]|nr:50S ribosomal protein L4 [Nanoarchaeota archaeon]
MVKSKLFDKAGNEKGQIELPKNFSVRIRHDILAKVFEAQRLIYAQPYGSMPEAGRQYSASGILRKRRHAWKGTYGKGISRVPRKIMSRHGTSFNWIGATVSSTRGGRRPHAPKAEENPFRKTNKKELLIGFNSAFVGTIDSKSLENKYGKKINSGFVFDELILNLKTKDFFEVLKKVFGDNFVNVLKIKTVRAGKGKMRGRKYKSNAGMLFVIASDEKMQRSGIDVVKVDELKVSDLSPNGEPGRIACYTEKAIKQIGEKFR